MEKRPTVSLEAVIGLVVVIAALAYWHGQSRARHDAWMAEQDRKCREGDIAGMCGRYDACTHHPNWEFVVGSGWAPRDRRRSRWHYATVLNGWHRPSKYNGELCCDPKDDHDPPWGTYIAPCAWCEREGGHTDTCFTITGIIEPAPVVAPKPAPKPEVADESDYPHVHGRSGPPAPKRTKPLKRAKPPAPAPIDEDAYSVTRRYTVHYCEPAIGHKAHWTVNVGRVPGWFVFVYRADVLRTLGPFDTREAAEEAGSAAMAA
jgi:hypothetical protein